MEEKQYFYRTEVMDCVVCGREMSRYKFRVYVKSKAGTYYEENMCQNCKY